MTRERAAELAAVLTGVQVGAAMVASRIALDDTGPFTLALVRYAIAVAVLSPVFVLAARVAVPRRDLAGIVALGVLQFALLIVFLNVSLLFVPPARVTVTFATLPVATMLVAAASGREALTFRLAGAGLLAVAGTAIAFSGEGDSAGPLQETIGIACALAATLSGAVCAVFLRDKLRSYPTVQVGFLAMAAATAALLPPALWEMAVAPPDLTMRGAAAIAFVGVSSGGGFLMWLFALKHASPSRATLLVSSSPVVAALLSAPLLGTKLEPRLFAGFLLILAAMAAVRRRRLPPAPAA